MVGFSGTPYSTASLKFTPGLPLLPWQPKFGTKSAITRIVWEISLRCLHLIGGFRGRAIDRCQKNSTTTNPRCHGNEIWDKIGYSSACTRDISEMFASNRGISGSGYWMMPDKFYHDHPCCHGSEIWYKIGYNSAYIRDILAIFASNRGFSGSAIEWCQSNFTATDPGCHGNEIWDETGYNSARIENIAVTLAPSRGYSCVGYWMMSDKFYHDQPRCHGNET